MKKLRYKGAVIDIPLRAIPDLLLSEQQSKDLSLFFRSTLRSSNIEKLKEQLSKIRRKRHIIAVLCSSVQMTKWVVLDHRIDALMFENESYKLFDLATARDAAVTGKVLEIPLRQVIYAPSHKRIIAIRYIRKAIQAACAKKCPIVVSSGATSPIELRAPRDLAALMNLFEIPYFSAINSVSTIVQELLEKNCRKLSEQFIAPNIWYFDEDKIDN
ncbi:MAG: RNase P subunit p30 family protein [Candidatus Hodarchaeota archaeon]